MQTILRILAAWVLLAAPVLADSPVINPVSQAGGVTQQTASVYANAGDGTYWYWAYSSAAEGSHFFVANAESEPFLNLDNPAWQEIDGDTYAYALGEWGPYGSPATAQERAALTDLIAVAMFGGIFEAAYYYIGWSDSLATLQAESSL